MKVMTREALFDAAWSRPLIQVAAELGVTSTALKKTCDRHDIPTPGRGYWAQVQAGRTFPRPKLRPARNSTLDQVRIVGATALPPEVRDAMVAAKEPVTPEAPANPQAINPQPAPEPAAEAGSEIRRELEPTRKAVAKGKWGAAEFRRFAGKGVVPMFIGEASAERALNWLGLMLEAAGHRGWPLQATDVGASLLVDGEPIVFRIEEKADKVPHVPTPKELADHARRLRWDSDARFSPEHDSVPSGRLAIAIDENSYSGLRRSFADGKARRLEGMVDDVLAAFAGHGALKKSRRLEAEARERAYARAEAIRKHEAAVQAREKQRMAFVEAIDSQLTERERLGRVLSHVEAVDTGDRRRLDALASWLRARITQIEALISSQSLDISARHAKIDFDEARAAENADSYSYYYPSKVELEFWSIDEEKGEARSQTRLAWARDAGQLPALELETDEAP